MGILTMMSDQFVQGGAQMSLVAAGSLNSGLRRKAHMQTTSDDHSQRIKMHFTQMMFFSATNTASHLRPVLHLLRETLNDDNSACCSLDRSCSHTLNYIPLE